VLPNFLLIGTAKGGTNALHTYLRAHPDVFMPDTKELKYFSHDDLFAKGPEWYSSLFPDGYAVRGEGSVQYSMYPNFAEVPQRILDQIPDVRFIYLMRDPIERMQSQYRHLLAVGLEHEPIERALLRDWPSLETYRRPEDRALYIHYSMYAMQLERYLGSFPRDRFLLLTSEALHNSRKESMRKVLSFLGLDPDWTAPVVDKEFHRGADRRTLRSPRAHAIISRMPGYRKVTSVLPQKLKARLTPLIVKEIDPGEQAIVLPPGFRSELEEILKPDVAKLRTYMDGGFDGWGIA